MNGMYRQTEEMDKVVSLPYRLVNLEGYRLLSEQATQRGDQNSCDNTHPVATYGIV